MEGGVEINRGFVKDQDCAEAEAVEAAATVAVAIPYPNMTGRIVNEAVHAKVLNPLASADEIATSDDPPIEQVKVAAVPGLGFGLRESPIRSS